MVGRMKQGFRVALATAMVVGLAGTSATAAAKPRFAVLYLDSQGFFGGIKKGIIEGSGASGVDLIESNSKSDPASEAAFIDSALASQVNGIIMSPVSTDASVATLERAKAAGIPVVCYNTCLSDADTKRLTAGFVTTDQYSFGHELGEAAAKYVKAKGIKPKVGLLNADRYEAGKQRKAGFLDALKAGVGDVEVVADQEGFIVDAATQVTTEMLTAHPEINLLWAINEGGTVGATLGVAAAKKVGATVVFGSDATAQIMDMLKNGEVLKASIVQDPQMMGRRAVELALAAAQGKPPAETQINIPTRLYLSDDTAGIDEWLKVHSDGIP